MNIEEILETQNIEALQKAIDEGLDVSTVEYVDFIENVENHKLDFFKLFFDNGGDINQKNKDDETALNIASATGKIDLVKFLLEYGESSVIKIDDINSSKEYASYVYEDKEHIFKTGNYEVFKEILKLLIQKSKKVNIDDFLIFIGNHDIEMIQFLLKYKFDINSKDENGITLLYFAVMPMYKFPELQKYNLQPSIKNQKKVIKLLVKNGADLNCYIKNYSFSFFPLIFSDIEIIEYLIELGMNVDFQDNSDELSMILMMNGKLLELVLFNQGNISDIKPLLHNFDTKKKKLIPLLIKNGLDINVKINNIPLFFNMIINKEFLFPYPEGKPLIEKEIYAMASSNFLYGDIKMVKLLLDNGVDVNMKYEETITPLMIACKQQNIKMIKVLLEYGADVNIENNIGKNAFDMLKQSDKDMFNLFMEYGYKESSFSISLYKEPEKTIIEKEFLEKNGTEENSIKTDDFFERMDRMKQENKEREKRENKIRTNEMMSAFLEIIPRTPMSKILQSKDIKALKELVFTGYDTSYVDLVDLIKYGYPIEFIDLILKKSNSINLKFKTLTPLETAIFFQNIEIVKLLIAYGADTEIKNNRGKKPIETAKNFEIKKILANPLKYQKKSYQPQKLVKILTNFTIDTPIKYTTHEWRNRIDAKYFNDFDLFLKDVSEQFQTLGNELKTLSPNLYQKVETFIVSTKNPNSWTSMKDLKPWVEDKKEPFDFPIANEHILFKTIIESFKNEIEIRGNMLQEIFLEHKKRLGRKFKITISDNLKGEKFYTDVETFKNAVDEIFREIEKYAKEQNEYEIEVELFKPQNDFIELHIIHSNSTSTREAEELLERIKQEKGDSVLKRYFKNLCDWEIKASCKNSHFRIDCFSEEIKSIEKPKGFTHIMRFYK